MDLYSKWAVWCGASISENPVEMLFWLDKRVRSWSGFVFKINQQEADFTPVGINSTASPARHTISPDIVLSPVTLFYTRTSCPNSTIFQFLADSMGMKALNHAHSLRPVSFRREQRALDWTKLSHGRLHFPANPV